MKRLPILAALALLAAGARAGPSAALTETDMLAELRSRRAALARAIGEGTVLLLPAPARGLHGYRQEPNFLYLTGLEDPRAAVLIRVERPEASDAARTARVLGDRLEDLRGRLERASARARSLSRAGSAGAEELAGEASGAAVRARSLGGRLAGLVAAERGPARVTEILYLPRRSAAAERWNGPAIRAGADAAARTGFTEVRDVRTLFEELPGFLPRDGRLFLLRRAPAADDRREELDALVESRPDLFVRDAAPALRELRGTKSAEEVARIRRACEVTCAGLREAMRSCRPGMAEYELQALLEYACRRGGAPRQAFPSIVGSGPNSTILHYHENRRTIEDGDLVLMDVGGEVLGYAADVTRTFPANGRFTKRQAEIYDIVLAAQEAGIAAVRPGATLAGVHRAARSVIAKAGYGRAFLHATSHYVGLDVHDPSPGRGPLAPGMVITVEPGIYLADEALGVRIEDTVLVTEDGAEVLSPGAPKTRAEIEALMREKGIGNLPIR